MKTLTVGNNIVVLHNHKPGNNYTVASTIAARLGCDTLAATDSPSLEKYDVVVFVTANAGDEELPPPMENFLSSITLTGKSYLVVEIGNYFGLNNYFGCRRVVIGLLDKLGWTFLGDLAVDSVPQLDEAALAAWVDEVQAKILRP